MKSIFQQENQWFLGTFDDHLSKKTFFIDEIWCHLSKYEYLYFEKINQLYIVYIKGCKNRSPTVCVYASITLPCCKHVATLLHFVADKEHKVLF